MSNKFLLKKSSVAAKVPLTSDLDFGELALNYADGLLYYKNSNNTVKSIGGSGSSSFTAIDQKSYIATAGQTSFAVAYTAPYVNVYLNGSRLNATDYTATSGTSITLAVAAAVGDEVELVGFSGTLLSNTTKANADVLVYNSSTGVWDNVAQSTLTAGNATKWATARNLSLTGDATATLSSVDGSAAVSAALTLATVNSNVGSFGSTTVIPVITVNAKGLITAVSTATISGSISVTGGDLTLSGNTGTAITNATLATVNSNVGSFGSSTSVPVVTVNAKGLVTAVSTSTITPAVGSITGLGTGVATFLATPSSANLAAALTDESGTNTVAFTTSPTFVTPILGDATATSTTYDHARLQSNTATTTATTTDQVLVSLAGASYRSAEFQIQATDSTGSKYHSVTIKAIHNGTTAVHTEYAALNIGGECATFNVDYSGGNLRLLCTPSSTNSTVFKITSIIGKV
jgi:hypothetical protein